jgi:hypothetical protein
MTWRSVVSSRAGETARDALPKHEGRSEGRGSRADARDDTWMTTDWFVVSSRAGETALDPLPKHEERSVGRGSRADARDDTWETTPCDARDDTGMTREAMTPGTTRTRRTEWI